MYPNQPCLNIDHKTIMISSNHSQRCFGTGQSCINIEFDPILRRGGVRSGGQGGMGVAQDQQLPRRIHGACVANELDGGVQVERSF